MSEQATAVGTDATSLKRFFKRHYGIPVRVSGGKRYVEVRVQAEPREDWRTPLSYAHRFPAELGVACVLAVYGNLVGNTKESPWCGNVSPHAISLGRGTWERVLAAVAAAPAAHGARARLTPGVPVSRGLPPLWESQQDQRGDFIVEVGSDDHEVSLNFPDGPSEPGLKSNEFRIACGGDNGDTPEGGQDGDGYEEWTDTLVVSVRYERRRPLS